MDNQMKLKMLKELDSKTDWEALIMQQPIESKQPSSSAPQQTTRKLTKSEKKKLKQKLQHEQVLEMLKKKNVETVVYNNPDAIASRKSHSSKHPTEEVAGSANTDNEQGVELDMKKTRYEIMKFGMSNLSSKDLEDAESALAISLGAKRPKRQAVNYKELQIDLKRKRDLAKEREISMEKPRVKGIIKKSNQPGKHQGKGKKRFGGDSRKSNNAREKNAKFRK